MKVAMSWNLAVVTVSWMKKALQVVFWDNIQLYNAYLIFQTHTDTVCSCTSLEPASSEDTESEGTRNFVWSDDSASEEANEDTQSRLSESNTNEESTIDSGVC